MERLGRYEILEELGRGAMGTVYRARDPKIDRIVAIKTISVAGLSPMEEVQYRQRFFREAQAAGQLSHGGIVTIYDVGEDEATRTPFIVMECVTGRTLEALASAERLSPETILDLVQQIAEALEYAHSRQIVHRDIKPANVLVTPHGQAKITDFGIAKLQMTQFTQTGYILGTPAYMSPEQLTGAAIDGRSDLFSLGVILYWLLTGDKPFTGETSTAISFKIVYKDPIPPSQLNPLLEPGFDHVAGRALAKDPSQRYQTGREFAADLDDLRNGHQPRTQAGAPGTEFEQTAIASASGARARQKPVALEPTPRAFAALRPPRHLGWLLPVASSALILLVGLAGDWWWKTRFVTSAEGAGPRLPETSAPAAPLPEPQTETPTGTTAGSGKPGPVRRAPERSPAVATREKPPAPSRGQPLSSIAPRATLRLTGKHNFAQATLYVYANGELLEELSLDGETAESRKGVISAAIPLPPGDQTISISIKAPGDNFDQIEYIQGSFAPRQSRTLEVSPTKAGRWLGVGRKLALRWLD